MSLECYYTDVQIQERINAGSFQSGTTWQNLSGSPYKGFIQPISGGETYRDGKAGEQATHRLYTSVQTPSIYGYKVIQNGQSYIMLYAIQPTGISGVDHHKEIVMGLFE